MSTVEKRTTGRVDPERYKAVLERVRLLEKAEAELLAMEQEPMVAYASVEDLFVDIDARVRARRGETA